MRLATPGREALAGWVGREPQPCDEDGAELPAENNSGSQNAAQIIPVPACGITWHIPDKRRSSLGGLVQKQKKLHPLLGVLLCRALHSLQNGKHVSPRHRENSKLCLSACLCKAAFCGGFCYCSSQERGSAAHQGGRASQMHLLPLGGTAGVMLYGYHKTSVLCTSCCSEAGIPGCQGGFQTRPCSITFQQNFTLQNKKVLCKNTYQVHMYHQESFPSVCRDAFVGIETTRTSPFYFAKEGIKTAEQ